MRLRFYLQGFLLLIGLLGFSAINEDAVRALSAESLEQLSQQGFLMPLFMMLASLSNMGRLIQFKQQARDANQ